MIRVDRLQGGLDAGRWPVTKDGQSLFWAGLNKGKRSLEADLRSEEGQELVTSLIERSGEDGRILLTNAVGRLSMIVGVNTGRRARVAAGRLRRPDSVLTRAAVIS